jgi:REP element-mobilizing transposase RayT
MPRRIRLFVAGGIYHVYGRVTRGEPIFEEPAEIESWIDAVAYEARLAELAILAWCLMSGHFHLVVRTGVIPLWRAMHRIQARIAREHNRRRGVIGPLWQSRYKARIVENQGDLEYLFAYVHLNPVAAGMVDDPADHRASGHRAIMGLEPPRLLDINTALATFGGNDQDARRRYLDVLRLVAEVRWHAKGVQELPWWRSLDDEELTMPVEEASGGAVTWSGRPLPPEVAFRPAISAVVHRVEAALEIPPGRLAGGTRNRMDSWNRCLFSTLAVEWLGFPVYQVARCLHKARGSVSRWLSEGLVLQQTNEPFRNRLAELRREFPQSEVLANGVSETPPL